MSLCGLVGLGGWRTSENLFSELVVRVTYSTMVIATCCKRFLLVVFVLLLTMGGVVNLQPQYVFQFLRKFFLLFCEHVNVIC